MVEEDVPTGQDTAEDGWPNITLHLKTESWRSCQDLSLLSVASTIKHLDAPGTACTVTKSSGATVDTGYWQDKLDDEYLWSA